MNQNDEEEWIVKNDSLVHRPPDPDYVISIDRDSGGIELLQNEVVQDMDERRNGVENVADKVEQAEQLLETLTQRDASPEHLLPQEVMATAFDTAIVAGGLAAGLLAKAGQMMGEVVQEAVVGTIEAAKDWMKQEEPGLIGPDTAQGPERDQSHEGQDFHRGEAQPDHDVGEFRSVTLAELKEQTEAALNRQGEQTLYSEKGPEHDQLPEVQDSQRGEAQPDQEVSEFRPVTLAELKEQTEAALNRLEAETQEQKRDQELSQSR